MGPPGAAPGPGARALEDAVAAAERILREKPPAEARQVSGPPPPQSPAPPPAPPHLPAGEVAPVREGPGTLGSRGLQLARGRRGEHGGGRGGGGC